MQNNTLAIYFSEAEYRSLEQTRQYTVLGISPLLNVLIKNGLEDIIAENKNEYVFRFPKKNRMDKKTYKTKIIRLNEKEYEQLAAVCASTPMSMSYIAKYMIMPQIDRILEEKRCNYQI